MIDKIYVDFKAPKTLGEFLEKFFSIKQISYAEPVETYHDKGCLMLQCGARRNRSLQDMLVLAKTYYPNTTLQNLVKELVVLKPFGYHLYPFYCSDIQRPVICYYVNKTLTNPWSNVGGEEYNWDSVLDDIGINTVNELYNYKKK